MDNKEKLICSLALAGGMLVGGIAMSFAQKSTVVHGESTKILAVNGAKIEKADNGKMVLIIPADSIETPRLKDGAVRILLKK